jgi:hypothetical protein
MKKIIPLPLLFIVSILMYSCCIIDEGVSFNKEIYDYDKFTNNRSNIFIEYSNSSVSNKEVVDENFPKNGKLYKIPYYFKYSISINCKSPQNIILQHCYITSGNGDTLETKILLNNKYLEFYNGVEQIVDSFPTIFSLFENKSNQSSLRQIDYKGSKWDIKNEFFFMSREQMMNLANENENDDMYNDCSVSEDRFVYRWLVEHREELSPMAKNVLDMAIELVEKSMKYRTIFNEDNEQYQINNWDCGWYQIKAMLKAYMPNELKAFNDLYKEFANQLRPMVYELGFLK